MRRRFSPLLVLLSFLAASCADGERLVDPDDATMPEVIVTRPVGNPPVEGALALMPPLGGGGNPWSFTVDLDGDGEADAVGRLEDMVNVPFSFEDPGLHRVGIVFTRSGQRIEMERSVNVLDPARIEILGAVEIEHPEGPSRNLRFEGIAVDRTGGSVFAGGFGHVFRFDTATLTLRDTLRAPPTNTLEGFAVAPDEERLYVVSKFLDLWVVDLEPFASEGLIDRLATGQYYLTALPGRRLYSSGNGELALIDVDERAVVHRLVTSTDERTEHFALSPSRDRVAAIVLDTGDGGFEWRIVLADAQLNETSRADLGDLFLEHVAWSPQSDRIYVRYGDDRPGDARTRSQRCGVFVLDASSLEVLDDVPLGVEGGCSARDRGRGVANPVASTPDGRFLVFPAPGGAFVFDTAVDRPVARTPEGVGGAELCCDAAASPNDDVFYVAGSGGALTKFRFLR